MDGHQFDDLLRRLAHSRRSLLGIAISSGAALAGHGQTDARKKKRKKKKKKQKPRCKGATRPCGQECIPTSTCCTPCGSLGTCIDGACVCLEGGKSCQGSCIPVANCCTSAGCGANAVCANGSCSCLSGFKTCQGQCISLGACCMNESNCGTDQDGSCICETSAGEPVCHKEGAVANHATCGECPGGTVCVKPDDTAMCYKLCGAA